VALVRRRWLADTKRADQAMSHGDYDTFWKNSGASVIVTLLNTKTFLSTTRRVGDYGRRRPNNYVELRKAKKSLSDYRSVDDGAEFLNYAGDAQFTMTRTSTCRAASPAYNHWLKGIDCVERQAPVRIMRAAATP
jgi:hypothetical protein